jgi:hypothetical protein
LTIAGVAHAGHVQGVVTDAHSGAPVEGATVYLSGTRGLEQIVITDASGHYEADVGNGRYDLVVRYAVTRSINSVVVPSDRAVTVDVKIDSLAGEVIEIRDREVKIVPAVPPKPTNYDRSKVPPYSRRAADGDFWTKAWLLLDVSNTGVVLRIKFLKRPGYDLDAIAQGEAFKLKFEPARTLSGQAVRSHLVWQFEWPSAIWARDLGLTTIPSGAAAHVPCRGSAPSRIGSIHFQTYRDCSTPDLAQADREAWIER